jgi:putative RecB family exonuclease
MTDTAPEHRSVSQFNTYQKCPYAYKLGRIDGVWSRPAAWLSQGSAVHEAAEAWERTFRQMTIPEAQNVFRSSYETHINEMCETTPDFNRWFASGPYRGEQDIERRYDIGLAHIETYINYYQNHTDEVIWVDPITGIPGIELAFDILLDGVLVRGFIDAVIQHGDDIIVRDLKTGRKPGDEFQLATYAVGVNEVYGVQPTHLDYMMTMTGKTVSHPIEGWSKEKIGGMFRELEDNIQAGSFPAKPSKAGCLFCDVSDSCEYKWRN